MTETASAVAAHEQDIEDLRDEVKRLRMSRKLTATKKAAAIGRAQRLIRDHRLAIDTSGRAGQQGPGEQPVVEVPARFTQLGQGLIERLARAGGVAVERVVVPRHQLRDRLDVTHASTSDPSAGYRQSACA